LDPMPGEWLLVHGAAGGVGSLFVQLARARGARVAPPASAQRQALVRELGAEVFVDRHAGQVAERACRVIGQELDMVADLVGYGTLAASLPMVREGGGGAWGGGRAGCSARSCTWSPTWWATARWRPASRWSGRVAGRLRSWSWPVTWSRRWTATSPWRVCWCARRGRCWRCWPLPWPMARCGRWWTRCWSWPMPPWPTGGSS